MWSAGGAVTDHNIRAIAVVEVPAWRRWDELDSGAHAHPVTSSVLHPGLSEVACVLRAKATLRALREVGYGQPMSRVTRLALVVSVGVGLSVCGSPPRESVGVAPAPGRCNARNYSRSGASST